jgi:hypothetical protein
MSKAVLCVHVHAACPCQYCMSVSILHVCVNIHVQYIYRNAGMPDRPASGQSGTGLKKTYDAGTGPVRYRTKLTQSGIFFSPVPD